MTLDLSKLKSQREEIKAAINSGKHIVYGYLRSKASATAVAGTPYYVGVASNAERPYDKHPRNSSRLGVPADERFVRLFASLDTREQACTREMELIAHYGRARFDPGGLLRNLTIGGDNGSLGYKFTEEQLHQSRETRMQDIASEYGVDLDFYMSLKLTERMMLRYLIRENGLNPDDAEAALEIHARGRTSLGYLIRKSQEIGISLKLYAELSPKQRQAMNMWLRTNPDKSAADYLSESREDRQRNANAGSRAKKMANACAKYRLSQEQWKGMTYAQRAYVAKKYRRRYATGLRGADLFAGLVPKHWSLADEQCEGRSA